MAQAIEKAASAVHHSTSKLHGNRPTTDHRAGGLTANLWCGGSQQRNERCRVDHAAAPGLADRGDSVTTAEPYTLNVDVHGQVPHSLLCRLGVVVLSTDNGRRRECSQLLYGSARPRLHACDQGCTYIRVHDACIVEHDVQTSVLGHGQVNHGLAVCLLHQHAVVTEGVSGRPWQIPGNAAEHTFDTSVFLNTARLLSPVAAAIMSTVSRPPASDKSATTTFAFSLLATQQRTLWLSTTSAHPNANNRMARHVLRYKYVLCE